MKVAVSRADHLRYASIHFESFYCNVNPLGYMPHAFLDIIMDSVTSYKSQISEHHE